MPGSRSLARRSLGELATRVLGGIAALLLGYAAVSQSFAYVLRESDVTSAHRLAPGNGGITALLSERLAGPYVDMASRRQADAMARLALKREPTAIAAVATLGLNAQIRGETTVSRRIFGYATRLSRRDLRTNLWAIEDAVGRGDVPGALRLYDIALRTSRLAPDLLFPVLAGAIANADVRENLVRTLIGRPAWGPLFIAYVGGSGPDATATARLFQDLRRRGVSVPREASTPVVNALISAGRFEDAWVFYSSITPGVDRRYSRDPVFTADGAAPSPFDWRPTEDPAITTSVQRGDTGGIFDFSVPSMSGGLLVQQMQMLPVGHYVIKGRSLEMNPSQGASPYWILRCRDGRELGRVAVTDVAHAGLFSGAVDVPPGCPVQDLILMAQQSGGVTGQSGQIERVQVQPAQQGELGVN